MNLHHATLVHWAEPGMRSACGAAGETSYDEDGVTCAECLIHLITEQLECNLHSIKTLRQVLALLDQGL